MANHKGGCGKTTLSVHLATGLARRGKRVLLVDLDPQGNATSWLAPRLHPNQAGAGELVLGSRGGPMFPLEDLPGLSLSPSMPSLAGLDLALAQEMAGEFALQRALEGYREDFDFVVLDCPPNLGLTVLNALCASDAVVSPVLSAYLSLVGLSKLELTVQRVRERCHVSTDVLGYVLFATDRREGITDDAREVLREQGKLFTSEVRVSTAAKTLPARRLTAWDQGADTRGASDYQAVLNETLRRLKGKAA